MNRATISPFTLPLSLMAKPVGARCNLACRYCYYLSKQDYYERGAFPEMSQATLEAYISQYIAAQTTDEVTFVWHGGEPLLRPLSFYEQVLALQARHADGHPIINCLQTNGTLLTDDWCRFLHDHHWLVGISVDGPASLHDQMRLSRGGGPTHAQVMRGIRLLQQYEVQWNAMAVVNRIDGTCYLCPGYQAFFDHCAADMAQMARELHF